MPLSRDIDAVGLAAILKTALDAVVVMRFDGTIAGWNEVAERTFGWTFEEAVGQRMGDLIVPHRFREAHEPGSPAFWRQARRWCSTSISSSRRFTAMGMNCRSNFRSRVPRRPANRSS
ncbi:MAG: PAS domain S-box protein [Sphingomonadales bacterium]|nr:MAG: PAS domain S-box protein [Sphingomonadales bacterium]